MKFRLAMFVMLLAVTVANAVANEKAKVMPDSSAPQKELIDEAKQFMRAAKQSLERWDQVPEKISVAIYYAGVRDGALGASLVLLVYAMILVRIKKP